MVKFDNVTKRFADTGEVALDHVSFHIFPGQLVYLMGESGAGKTTMMRLLLGELTSDEGEIWVNGQKLSRIKGNKKALYRQSIGMVFQDFKLIEDMSVYDNVALKKIVTGASAKGIREQVTSALRVCDMEHKFAEKIENLSGGEKQRACIARALVGNPSLILADEPTGNLDPAHSKEIMNLLCKINALGTTVIIATHDEAAIDITRGRIFTVRDGKIIS